MRRAAVGIADGDGSGREEDNKEADPVQRQTFVYSATYTLPPLMHHLIKTDVRDNPRSKKA